MKLDKKGLLGTVVFHSIILILFMVFGFTTPLPLPGEEGILINFGADNVGLGTTEPAMAEPQARQEMERQPSPPVETSQAEAEESVMTQNIEEAPAVASSNESIIEESPEPVQEETKPVEQPEEEKPVEEPRRPDPRTLYPGRSTSSSTSSSEGVTQAGGNQGSPSGSTESSSYIGEGLGTEGISFSLEGRGKVTLPEPRFEGQKQGIVVVEIIVDRDGNVISAREGVRGSTTADPYLLNAAKEAALKSKFTAKSDAAVRQRGQITYQFKLQ